MRPGSIFLIHPDDATTYRIHSGSLELYNIIFMPQFLTEDWCALTDRFDFFSIFQRKAAPPEHQLYQAQANAEILHLVRMMEKEYDRAEENFHIRLRLQMMELLLLLSRQANRKKSRRSAEQVGNDIKTALKKHFLETDFRLNTIADELRISPSRLCRLYRTVTGKTIMGTLRELRLNEAERQLLEYRQLPISEIAGRCGFHDLSAFYRAFKKRNGQSPLDFQNGATSTSVSAASPPRNSTI